MKRAHWLSCGGGLLALVVVLLVAGAPAVSALLIAALLICRAAGLPAVDADHVRYRKRLGQLPADRTPANSGKAFAQPDVGR